MADQYRTISKRGDVTSLGFTTTARIEDPKTGKTGTVHIYSGTPQQERDRIGKHIEEGRVRWDNDQ